MSYKIAMRYKDTPPTPEEFNRIKNKVANACRHYILGRAYIAERNRHEKFCDAYDIMNTNYGYTKASLQKILAFTKAVDSLEELLPKVVRCILDGKIRLSMDNTVMISRKTPDEILHIVKLLSDKKTKVCDVIPPRPRKKKAKTTVKDPPPYDPDSQIMSLSYTIPSWVGAIEKVFMDMEFNKLSTGAKHRLKNELLVLLGTATAIYDIMEDENNVQRICTRCILRADTN